MPYENRQPAPAIKLFKFQLAELPAFLLVYLTLVVGAVIGWVAHGLRIRRKRREAQAAQTASAQQQQESQEGQGGRQAQYKGQRQDSLKRQEDGQGPERDPGGDAVNLLHPAIQQGQDPDSGYQHAEEWYERQGHAALGIAENPPGRGEIPAGRPPGPHSPTSRCRLPPG